MSFSSRLGLDKISSDESITGPSQLVDPLDPSNADTVFVVTLVLKASVVSRKLGTLENDLTELPEFRAAGVVPEVFTARGMGIALISGEVDAGITRGGTDYQSFQDAINSASRFPVELFAVKLADVEFEPTDPTDPEEPSEPEVPKDIDIFIVSLDLTEDSNLTTGAFRFEAFDQDSKNFFQSEFPLGVSNLFSFTEASTALRIGQLDLIAFSDESAATEYALDALDAGFDSLRLQLFSVDADGSLDPISLFAPTEGTSENDTLVGTANFDEIFGFEGNDRIEGRGSADRIIGGDGKDVLKGGNGDDTISGNAGRDRLLGNRPRPLSSRWQYYLWFVSENKPFQPHFCPI
ncbi:MAG: calcium-binding protein [Arenibacterium sp.]